MIRCTEGNLLEAPVEALVNTVNEVGVMGKGIALMFREAFPESAKEYQEACARQEVKVGRVLLTRSRTLVGPRWIIHFPTKKHWRHRSRMEWVREGLKDLVRVAGENGIRSLALPPLGCGSGGLEWSEVRKEIEAAFAGVRDVDVLVYEPTEVYPRITSVKVTDELITAHLVDGRTISVPLAWSYRLSEATPEQRARHEIIGDGEGIHWPDIDEDISARGMLVGIPARRRGK